MTRRSKVGSKTKNTSVHDVETFPFHDGEEAWFWFIQAQQARNEGARYTAGMSLKPRPCEPADILKILDRLYRNRRLLRDHLLVLRHYGRRQMAPDPRRVKEAIAYKLWCQAMERIELALIAKGIMYDPAPQKEKRELLTTPHPNKFWSTGAKVHNGFQTPSDMAEGAR